MSFADRIHQRLRLLIFERIFGASEITQFFYRELEARFVKRDSWESL